MTPLEIAIAAMKEAETELADAQDDIACHEQAFGPNWAAGGHPLDKNRIRRVETWTQRVVNSRYWLARAFAECTEGGRA